MFKDNSIQFVTQAGATNVIHVCDEVEEFIVSAHGKGGIYAYNSTTGALKWHAEGK